MLRKHWRLRRPFYRGRRANNLLALFADAERELIASAIKATAGKHDAAAAMLRIFRETLYAKIDKYGL